MVFVFLINYFVGSKDCDIFLWVSFLLVVEFI